MYLDKGIVIHINLCIYWETIIHIIHIITYWIAMLTLMNLDKTSFSVWQTSSIKSQFHTIPFKEFHFAYFWRSSSICLRGGRSPCTTSITLCKERLNHSKVFFSPPMSARIKNQFGTFPRPDQIWPEHQDLATERFLRAPKNSFHPPPSGIQPVLRFTMIIYPNPMQTKIGDCYVLQFPMIPIWESP